MARKTLSERQDLQIRSGREMEIYKANDMIQKGRHELSLQEQRCVLYAISKIKPKDTVFQEYTFELGDFYKLCGLQGESYTELKSILIGLKQKTWWVETTPNVESTVSWFNKVRTNKKSGTVTIRFDDDMMPYLLELTKDKFYTHYQLKYILPMKSQYAIRLYELLKSYQWNNIEWFFDVEQLKKQLNCENYKNFYDFRRWVIEPAVAEINEYTDIKIAWEPVKEGRKVVRVIFFMAEKKKADLLDADRAINDALDGQIDILELMQESQDTVKAKFLAENRTERSEGPSKAF
ncbi:replication initiation protein [Intestinimonas sp. MSJ-38]|uniref:replication initiation protein n=1 Tax=Intestinimonas sp. MSJ-38 TaxID=2841532 RepID=UPI001C121268|nr:replication initiation protein [Intestinimonas sp. MSJ-38]MBU5433956.1 replication initiation protein [Intestinimonas sp. MSJ-38]